MKLIQSSSLFLQFSLLVISKHFYTYAFDVKIELSNGPKEVLSIDENGLLFLKQLCQVIHDKEDAFILVGTHHDVGLLEVLGIQRLLGRLVQEGTVDDGDEGEFGAAENDTVPLAVDQIRRIFGPQTFNGSTQIFAVMRTFEHFS